MSALYTAVRLAGDWVTLPSALSLDGVADALVDSTVRGSCDGFLRLDTGEEVGFKATTSDNPDGSSGIEILVDDANEAALKAAIARAEKAEGALAEIAALQTKDTEETEREWDHQWDAYRNGYDDGQSHGEFRAAEIARKALGSK